MHLLYDDAYTTTRDLRPTPDSHRVSQICRLLVDFAARVFDFLFARKEHQHIAWGLVLVDLNHCTDGSFQVVALGFLR